jgi:hypothetical protein
MCAGVTGLWIRSLGNGDDDFDSDRNWWSDGDDDLDELAEWGFAGVAAGYLFFRAGDWLHDPLRPDGDSLHARFSSPPAPETAACDKAGAVSPPQVLPPWKDLRDIMAPGATNGPVKP